MTEDGQTEAWREHLSEPIWEEWELDPAEVARRQGLARAAEVARRESLSRDAAAQRSLRGAEEHGAEDSDDVSEEEADAQGNGSVQTGAIRRVPAPSRGATLRYRAQGNKTTEPSVKTGDANCMLECYAHATAPRPLPRDWPPEPRCPSPPPALAASSVLLAIRFYRTLTRCCGGWPVLPVDSTVRHLAGQWLMEGRI